MSLSRIYLKGTQVIIARENGDEAISVPAVETSMTLYSSEVAIAVKYGKSELVKLPYVNVMNESGALVGNKAAAIAYLSGFISSSSTYNTVDTPVYTIAGKNDLAYDVWGTPRTVQDHSLFSGLFTFNVPVSKWKEVIDDVEQSSFTNATSVDGKLNLTSAGVLNERVVLDSFQNPRYEANRGHKYSTAGYIPNPTAQGERRFGLFTNESGCFFKVLEDGLYACVRTTVTGLGTFEDVKKIDTTGIDLAKGNTYDIKFQWRGVGDYFFYINLVEVAHFEYLGTTAWLSMWNPALPVAFECINKGDDVVIQIGCVDVTTEGGDGNGTTYGSLAVPTATNDLPLIGANCPALIVHNKSVLGDGRRNTRDVIALLLTAWADSKGVLKVYVTRDPSAFTLNDQSWTDYGDGHLEYIWFDNPDVATPVAFDTAKATQTFGARLQANITYETDPVFGDKTEIGLYPGDYLVFTIHKDNFAICNGGVTFEFSERI